MVGSAIGWRVSGERRLHDRRDGLRHDFALAANIRHGSDFPECCLGDRPDGEKPARNGTASVAQDTADGHVQGEP